MTLWIVHKNPQTQAGPSQEDDYVYLDPSRINPKWFLPVTDPGGFDFYRKPVGNR